MKHNKEKIEELIYKNFLVVSPEVSECIIKTANEYAEYIHEQIIQEAWIILCDMIGDDNNGIGQIDLDEVHEKFKLLKQKQTINNINNLSKQ